MTRTAEYIYPALRMTGISGASYNATTFRDTSLLAEGVAIFSVADNEITTWVKTKNGI